MAALPKKKITAKRRGDRRAHSALKAPQLESCPQCHSPKLPHHVCPTCGTYNGREVIKMEAAPKKTE
ncbi:MAG: 50S ribosomal protein L32 [Dehalococcoidales bacterium]|nr:50S ribosomal protein L32 [Dehalococcoidales bacterium]